MSSKLRSMCAAAILAATVLVFSVAVVSPYLPQEIARPVYRTDQELVFDSVRPVRIENPEGSVRVVLSSAPGIRVEAEIRAYARTAEAAAAAQGYADRALQSSETETEIRIAAGTGAAPAGMKLRSEVTLFVPEGTDVTVAGGNGNIWVEAGCGAVHAVAMNGDITVQGPRGTVEALTDNGRISLYDAPEKARLETQNGSIYAHMLGGELEARTVNGYIGATLLDPAVRRCELTSMNGGITLALGPSCAARVDAGTGRGTVKSDVPSEPALPVEGARTWRGDALGTEGPGAADRQPCQVTMRTRNGNLSIRRGGS